MRENEERWKKLSALAAKEQDPVKLRELVHEINDLLLRKLSRVDADADTDAAKTKAKES